MIRPYTPTSVETLAGYVDFVIKDYPQGVMSSHVHSLKVGDTIDIKGPFEKWNWEKKPVAQVGMVAGMCLSMIVNTILNNNFPLFFI